MPYWHTLTCHYDLPNDDDDANDDDYDDDDLTGLPLSCEMEYIIL